MLSSVLVVNPSSDGVDRNLQPRSSDMASKQAPHSGKKVFEAVLIVLICLSVISILFQLKTVQRTNRSGNLGQVEQQTDLVDVEVATIMSLLGDELKQRWTFILLERSNNIDASLIGFLDYATRLLPNKISVHAVTLVNVSEPHYLDSNIQYHIDSELYSRGYIKSQVAWASCLVVLNADSEAVYLKYNPTKNDVAMFISGHIIEDSIINCSNETLSLSELDVYSIADSSLVNISHQSHVVIYSSICSQCGEDALLNSIEGRLRSRGNESEVKQRIRDLLVLFPMSSDHSRLRDFLGDRFPLMAKSSLSFGLFTAPQASCVSIRTLRGTALILELRSNDDAKVISPRELLRAIDNEVQY